MIEIKNLSKVFQTSDGKVDALKNISLTIEDGDIYGIIGMSGAGKSTLVRCINMLERPTEGSVLIDKKNIGELSPKELRSIRREITMIFQGFILVMQKTCLKNIMFPLKLAGVRTEEAKKKAGAEYERVLKNADEEAAAKMQQAEEAIKVEKEKSMRKMQDEIKDLVVSVASKVVGDQVSAEDSSRLYDDFIAEMGEKK